MALNLIRISNLRNISDGLLAPSLNSNIIVGSNGSGKSSLLEAIYILGRGRTFRGSRIGPVIKQKEKALEVYGETRNQQKNIRIGIRKTRVGTEVRINSEKIKRLSSLAVHLPLHLITPNSYQIIEGSADYRRRFIEWGVFHVEHQYRVLSDRYRRVLAQRNASLKSHPASVRYWDTELSSTGEMLNDLRFGYLKELESIFHYELSLLLPQIDIQLLWKKGWQDDLELKQAIVKNFDKDLKYGYTSVGPHRSDLQLTIEDHSADQKLSRGQKKLVVASLVLAQAELQKIKTGRLPVLLIDDYTSELDKSNQDRFMKRLFKSDSQLFVTTNDLNEYHSEGFEKMFHVEHGVVEEEGV